MKNKEENCNKYNCNSLSYIDFVVRIKICLLNLR